MRRNPTTWCEYLCKKYYTSSEIVLKRAEKEDKKKRKKNYGIIFCQDVISLSDVRM